MGDAPTPQGADAGGVTISDSVVVKITLEALKGIEGIAALGGGAGGVLSSIMGDKASSGVSVDVREGSVDIDISLSVLYGHNVPAVAEAVRASVKEKVESLTGLAVRAVNVLVTDVEFPEDGYRGAYITDIAREIFDEEGDAWADRPADEREAHFKEKAYQQVLEHLKRVLHAFGLDFDVWFSERTLHAPGPDGGPSEIERAIARLREAGHVYEHEGAVWFRSTAFGDDKDRVLVKADGSYTYFAADVAYHWDKFGVRGFDRVIDLWGADHHGYVKRMEAAVAALGFPGQLEVIIGQMVNLFRNGEVVRMSKRTGEMVTFEELLDEVGADAVRYFFLRRSTDQSLDFDIGLAKQQTNENPVFYVQYAHARICSILRKAADSDSDDVDALAARLVPEDTDLSLLAEDAELALVRKIAEFPDVAAAAAEQRAPHRLTRYAEDLATAFHQFYTVCRVIDPDEPALTAARLALCDATRLVIAAALRLLGVSAPVRM